MHQSRLLRLVIRKTGSGNHTHPRRRNLQDPIYDQGGKFVVEFTREISRTCINR